jgi:hypothetical protein
VEQFSSVERGVESRLGLPVETIRKLSPGELRDYLNRRSGSSLKFVSEFPSIGRGNVLHDCIVDSVTINSEIDKILK